jgi:hypothetical protein
MFVLYYKVIQHLTKGFKYSRLLAIIRLGGRVIYIINNNYSLSFSVILIAAYRNRLYIRALVYNYLYIRVQPLIYIEADPYEMFRRVD